jgi:two-component system KDP operon response regulator KdpE
MIHVLLVEDDPELRRTLAGALAVEGHQVRAALSVADALCQFRQASKQEALDVILLDLSLPDGDGMAVLEEARRHSSMPVIVISARHEEDLRVKMLDAGADDYLVKPFGIPELLARIRVTLRHRGRLLAPAITRYEHGPVMVDLARRHVARNGQEVRLTPTEWNLLARLVRSAGKVVTHRQLLADVWGADYVDHTHYLRLYMSQLRGKLEDTPAMPVFLLSDPGVGYRLAEPA